MIKFKIGNDIFSGFTLGKRQMMLRSGFVNDQLETKKSISSKNIKNYDLSKLAVGEAYCIDGNPMMPITQKASKHSKDGKIFTVNQKLGVVVRLK